LKVQIDFLAVAEFFTVVAHFKPIHGIHFFQHIPMKRNDFFLFQFTTNKKESRPLILCGVSNKLISILFVHFLLTKTPWGFGCRQTGNNTSWNDNNKVFLPLSQKEVVHK